MPTVVISPAIGTDRLTALQAAAPDLELVNAQTIEQARQAIAAADGFFGKITPELLQAAPQLRWVQSPTASLEHYLFPELIAHPCQLTNMRGLFSDVIADHVLGLVVMLARNLHRYRDYQRRSHWGPVGDEQAAVDFVSAPGVLSPIDLAHRHLGDCTLGVVGVGAIGCEIARRASAFGMTVCGVDPHPRKIPGVIDQTWPMERLDELLGDSDFTVIAAPHTPQTEGLLDLARLQKMKPNSFLINIGRGAIVKLDALQKVLEAGHLAGAALDVFETEPLPHEHPLWQREDVIITPHIAAASPRVSQRHLESLCENFRRFAAGEELLNQVNKAAWY